MDVLIAALLTLALAGVTWWLWRRMGREEDLPRGGSSAPSSDAGKRPEHPTE